MRWYVLASKEVIPSYVAFSLISLFRKAWLCTLHETVRFSALLNTSFIEDERCVRSLLFTILLMSLFFIEILRHYKDFLITLYVVWLEVFTALLGNAMKTLDNKLHVPGRLGAGNFQRAFCSSDVCKVLWSRRVQFAVNGQTKWDRRLIMWLTPW